MGRDKETRWIDGSSPPPDPTRPGVLRVEAENLPLEAPSPEIAAEWCAELMRLSVPGLFWALSTVCAELRRRGVKVGGASRS